MSAALAASVTLRTSSPAASAFFHDAPPGRSPTMTFCPDSLRFSAWAWPWLPKPMTAIVRPRRRSILASLS